MNRQTSYVCRIKLIVVKDGAMEWLQSVDIIADLGVYQVADFGGFLSKMRFLHADYARI